MIVSKNVSVGPKFQLALVPKFSVRHFDQFGQKTAFF